MFALILEIILLGIDAIISAVGKMLMSCGDHIINGVFQTFVYYLGIGKNSAYVEAISERGIFFNGVCVIAGTLAFAICIYGFLIENLDFHTYDGWDRVIRLLIRIALISIMLAFIPDILEQVEKLIINANAYIGEQEVALLGSESLLNRTYSPTYGGKIGSYWPGTATTAGGVNINFNNELLKDTNLSISGLAGAWTTFNSWFSVITIPTDGICPIQPAAGYPSAITEAAKTSSSIMTGLRLSVIFEPASFIYVCWCVLTHCIAIIAMIALTVLILKKIFKMALNLLVPFIELRILLTCFPIGLAFYASHSTQHVAQSYVRNLFKTGLQFAFKILVIIVMGLTGTALLSRIDIMSWVDATTVNQLTYGHANDIVKLFMSLMVLTVTEMALDRTEHLSAKVFGG